MTKPKKKNTKKQVAVLFGGRSVEHEISVITGLQLIAALDTTTVDVVPVYIAQDGRWYSDEILLEKTFYKTLPKGLADLTEVTLLPKPGIGGLTILDHIKECTEDDFDFEEDNSPTMIPVDVFIPAFHGQFGEDGCLQGLFEMADVIYTGSKVLPLALSMNKYLCKCVASAHGVPVLPGVVVDKHTTLHDLAATHLKIFSCEALQNFPLFVKPVNLGSSIGISRANSIEELNAALLLVFKYDDQALVEPCVSNIMEINIAVLDADEPVASVVEIPVSDTGVLSYEEKYLRGGGKKTGESSGMASLTRVINPPDLDPKIKEAVTKHALIIYKALKCSGGPRLDFMMDTSTGTLYFNEINPLPGSLAFYLWAKSTPQLLYTELLNVMIERAIELKNREKSLERKIEFRALLR